MISSMIEERMSLKSLEKETHWDLGVREGFLRRWYLYRVLKAEWVGIKVFLKVLCWVFFLFLHYTLFLSNLFYFHGFSHNLYVGHFQINYSGSYLFSEIQIRLSYYLWILLPCDTYTSNSTFFASFTSLHSSSFPSIPSNRKWYFHSLCCQAMPWIHF